jgi:hypothetical protein
MIAFLIVIFVLVCIGGARKHTKATAANTAELLRYAKLPPHMRHLEQVESMPREQRRAFMRQEMVSVHGPVALSWSHDQVRNAYRAYYHGTQVIDHEALYHACLKD